MFSSRYSGRPFVVRAIIVGASIFFLTGAFCNAQPAPTALLQVKQEVNGVPGDAYFGGNALFLDVRAAVAVPAGDPGPVTFLLSFYLEDDDTPPNRPINVVGQFCIVAPGNGATFGDNGLVAVPGMGYSFWYYGEAKVWHVVGFMPIELDFQDYYFYYAGI